MSVGYGAGYGGFGGQVAYYVQLSGQAFRLAPYVGLGDGYSLFGKIDWVPGLAGGVSATWGRNHRGVLDVGFGPLGYAESLTGAGWHQGPMWGPWLVGGYEYMASSGFFLRTAIGVGLVVAPTWVPSGTHVGPAFTLIAFGWKLW